MAIEHQPPDGFKLPWQERLIFLAGPIQGAPDWQEQAINLLNTNYHVANPRHTYPEGTFDYDKQVEWEWLQLERAAEHGGIIFWFAAQDYNLEYEEGRPYAQTSRIEFGEVFGWKKYHSVNVAVGIEPGYEGGNERYFRKKAKHFGIPVRDSLARICHDVMQGTKG